MYQKFFTAIKCEHICGLTATPFRIVQRFFKEGNDLFYSAQLQTINRIYPFFFKKFAFQISIASLIEQGYLARPEYKTYDEFDVDGLKVNTTGTDYDEKALENFWNDARLKRLAQIIGSIDSECRHNLIFCSSIRQARDCTAMLRMLGINCDYVTSEHDATTRDELIRKFRSGEIKHLANVGVLSIGFDFPELDAVTVARPTMSLALYYQQIGRGMRVTDDKQSLKVYDITNNLKRMGRVETIQITKEPGGFKSIVTTDRGIMTGKPLFKLKAQRKFYDRRKNQKRSGAVRRVQDVVL
jgi:DNA repair protein RadD